MGHVFPLIDRKSLIDVSEGKGVVPASKGGDADDGGEFKGSIELRAVKFIYPARPSVVVFKWVGRLEQLERLELLRSVGQLLQLLQRRSPMCF